MKSTKLYTILESFNAYEQNRLRKYLISPYFNKDDSIVQLFDLIIEEQKKKKYKDDFQLKEGFWKKMKPKSSYDDVRFRKYCSDLLKLIEGYLAQKEFEKNPICKTSFMMNHFLEADMSAVSSSLINLVRKQMEKAAFQDLDFFYYGYKILDVISQSNRKKDEKFNIEEMSDLLDKFFICAKLRLLCEGLSTKTNISHDYRVAFEEEILDLISTSPTLIETPSISIFYHIYLVYTEPENTDHYYKLKKLLDDHALKFPIQEARDNLYLHAQNYCLVKINQGNVAFQREFFELYNDLLNKNLVVADNKLNSTHFRNIIIVALRLNEFEWAEKFITDYQHYLPESLRFNTATYSLATVYFYQKKYGKVIEILRDIEFEDITVNLNSKTMLIATFYELDEFDPLDFLLESFRTYLNRKKEDLTPQKRINYLNLIKFTKRLTKIQPGDRKAIDKLNKEIDEAEGVVSVKWLKEKIEELK